MYEEMRRWRNTELEVGRWNSTMVLGAIAGLVAALQISNFKLTDGMRIAFVVAVTVVTVLNSYFIWYCGWRYRQMRRATEVMEPPWKRIDPFIRPLPRLLNPLLFNILTQLILAGAFIFLVVEI
jgi:hypothetical protein